MYSIGTKTQTLIGISKINKICVNAIEFLLQMPQIGTILLYSKPDVWLILIQRLPDNCAYYFVSRLASKMILGNLKSQHFRDKTNLNLLFYCNTKYVKNRASK